MIIPGAAAITKKPERKFGLAWLFSLENDEEAEPAAFEDLKTDIDERIRGTWLTLEASKKERCVEAATRQFSRWQTLSWPRNCTVPPPVFAGVTR